MDSSRDFTLGFRRYSIGGFLLDSVEPTWNVFSGSDIALALIGLAGFVSVWVVLSTALGLNVKRELSIRKTKENQKNS
jgi:hypothetical protein